ncbi:MAG: VWA domain-containing protein [Pyrinomonadaceae bacterium]|nr:VWA domain-containing protein [Pyrinomonadaceae bacterium]
MQKGIIFVILFLSIFICFPQIQLSQNKTPTPSPTPINTEGNNDNEILKIESSLIQTGVTVLDKKGQFVQNLKQDDFEVKVDGKPVVLSFFESVIENQIIAESKSQNKNNKQNISQLTYNGRGRTIIFVVDDLHLSFESHARTRDLILKFIDNDFELNDILAIVSTSGKIGFLQQFTNDKIVLKKAVDRLIYNRNFSGSDRLIPPMSDYEALLIDRRDPEVTNVFAQLMAKEYPGSDYESNVAQVRTRASSILVQARILSENTLKVLDEAIRRAAQREGRKIVFFLSDGFLTDPVSSDSVYLLHRITDAAARTNTVVYSFDVKGLEAGLPEGTTAANAGGQTGYRIQSGERFEVQDGLSTIADTTGGRFITNSNDLKTEVGKALVEASGYYLLAWEPDIEIISKEKLKKVEVFVKGHPDLKVRLQNGYLGEVAEKGLKKDAETESAPSQLSEETQLRNALNSQFLQNDLPTSMVLNYLDLPNEGGVVKAAIQIKNEFLEFTKDAEENSAKVDFLGSLYNSDGKKEGYFKDRITVSSKNKSEKPDLFYNLQTILKPGLYQIRIATRDVKSGKLGNAVQWINIPDLTKHKLALSSLLLSENSKDNFQKSVNYPNDSSLSSSEISVNRIFQRSSNLRYVIFIYNTKLGKNNLPDITVQTQLFRKGKLILDGQPRQLSLEGQDLERLYYAAELPLNSFPSGQYEIKLTIQDKNINSSLEQMVSFEIR